MTIQETIKKALETGREIRPIGNKDWYYVDKDGNIRNTNNDFAIGLNKDNILIEWEIKERWYEGDFKKKYPNGVLCWVGDNKEKNLKRVVSEYDKNRDEYCFIERDKNNTIIDAWSYAEPVKPEKAPAIIGSQNDT